MTAIEPELNPKCKDATAPLKGTVDEVTALGLVDVPETDPAGVMVLEGVVVTPDTEEAAEERDDDEPLEVDDMLELIVGAMAKAALVE